MKHRSAHNVGPPHGVDLSVPSSAMAAGPPEALRATTRATRTDDTSA